MSERDVYPSDTTAPIRITLPSPGRILLVLTAVTTLLAIVGTSLQVYRYSRGLSRTFQMLNLNEEASIGTWYSVSLLVMSAIACLITAAARSRTRKAFARHWLFLGLIFMGLSVDEIICLHERTQEPIRTALNLGGPLYFSWILLGIPFFIIVALAYLPFLRHLPAHTRQIICMAAALYVGGAVGIEMVGGIQASARGMDNLTFVLLAHLEETMEMLGASLFLYAVLTHLGDSRPGYVFGFDGAAQSDVRVPERARGPFIGAPRTHQSSAA